MKNGDKVVCIDAKETENLIEGEIYKVIGLGHVCEGDQLIEVDDGLSFMAFGFCPHCHCLYTGYAHRLPSRFRPVDDTFGEVVAEIIEKMVEVEQMETV